MINIPAGIIIIWPGTNAGIPTGFTRETALDGLYPKGANGSNQNTGGGSANHSHTSPNHAHDIEAHQHTFTIPDIANPYHDRRLPNPANGDTTQQNHTHNGTTNNNVQPGTSGPTALTYGSVSNDPPYVVVIFIKGDGAHGIPDDAVMLFANSSLPANYSQLAALENKFLKGAAAAGDGGATGGSNTNVHDIGHGHSAGSHDHGSATSGSDLNYTHNQTSGARNMVTDHTHAFTPAAASVAVNNFVGSLTCPEAVEPLFKKLLAIQKAAGGDLVPGIIGMWLGAIADIPSGWNLCDGASVSLDLRDCHLKVAANTGEINTTGGSNTHTHAAQPHTHTASAHNHAIGTQLGHSATTYNGQLTDDLSGMTPLIDSQVHQTFNVDNAGANYQAANTTADSASNEPQFLRVHFIMFNKTFTQKTLPGSYKLRRTHQITLPGSYKTKIRKTIILPGEYVMRKINWDLIPKPNL